MEIASPSSPTSLALTIEFQAASITLSLARSANATEPWKFGIPPAGNANYAWLQHMYSRLSARGRAGIVLANGSMSSAQSGEGEIRKAMIKGDAVECMLAMPGQLFSNTQIPACLWFLSADKKIGINGTVDRRGQVLFIDARKLSTSRISRTQIEYTDDDLQKISQIYHRWRGTEFSDGEAYADQLGLCKSTDLKEISEHGYLSKLGIPEVHLYDRDDDVPPKYQLECDAVNARKDGSWAAITAKRELENYLHSDAITEGMDGIAIAFTDTCDVPLKVAEAVHLASESTKPWAQVLADGKALDKKVGLAKKRLNREAASRMTSERLAHIDAAGEVSGWLRRIHGMLG